MSSGFVSAGTNEQPVERDDEWLRAQKELDEERRRKAEIGKQTDGKSLFEVLEANKSELLLQIRGPRTRWMRTSVADMLG
jgi:N-terminal domain of NEFA-interacting nuclear protein NIP30.